MKPRITPLAAALAAGALILSGTFALAATKDQTPPFPLTQLAAYGPMMGHGWGYGAMPHHGIGYGPMMGYGTAPCHAAFTGETSFTVDDVRKVVESQLAWQGNTRLKVGKVTQTDQNTIVVEIVTTDNSLVERLEFDRTTGFTRRVN